jgi:hypothetical protein
MRFVLYTDKTIAQCLRELNERMQAKPTKSRPEIGGWIRKDGSFMLSLTGPVIGRFRRTTRLSAEMERDRGTTVIRGAVSDGLSPFWLRLLYIGLIVVILMLIVVGEPGYAVLAAVFGLVAYIPLRGDYINSDLLLIEIERNLKASPKPPKK